MHSSDDTWQLATAVNPALAEQLTDRLVDYNQTRSTAVQERFRPGNLDSEPVHAFAVEPDGALVGGCTGRVERVWHWLNIDAMWVRATHRGEGIGLALLEAVEDAGRQLGCRWSDVTTFDFQAPDFYRKAGYVDYGVKQDYPPGHANYFLCKPLGAGRRHDVGSS